MIRCKATKIDGRPCEAPSSLVNPESGFCPSHAPGASERLSEQGRRGAEATARKLRGEGLDPDELPPLDSHDAAKEWLEIVGRAVSTRRIQHNEATAIIKAVEAWLKAAGEGEAAKYVREFLEDFEKMKDKGTTPLKAVK